MKTDEEIIATAKQNVTTPKSNMFSPQWHEAFRRECIRLAGEDESERWAKWHEAQADEMRKKAENAESLGFPEQAATYSGFVVFHSMAAAAIRERGKP